MFQTIIFKIKDGDIHDEIVIAFKFAKNERSCGVNMWGGYLEHAQWGSGEVPK